MKRYCLIMGLVLLLFLGLFAVVEALGVPILTDPQPWLAERGPYAAAVGLGLLAVDVVLPVPASLVMIAHGGLFGVALGAVLSMVGSLLASWAGFAIGRRGSGLIAKLVPAEDRDRIDRLLGRWGTLAVLVTRPVPLLAETMAIMAGASTLRWWQMTWASAVGIVPAALLYALTGATAARLDSGLLVFGLVLSIAGLVWVAGRALDRSAPGVADSRVL